MVNNEVCQTRNEIVHVANAMIPMPVANHDLIKHEIVTT